MRERRGISPILVTVIALIVVVVAVAVGWRVVNGDRSLLRNVTVGHERITPNADGDSDATPIRYEISRNATVSIYFDDEAGQRFYFREEKARGAGQYEVLFSGVVDSFTLPEDEIQAEILARLLPNGRYSWTIEAIDEQNIREIMQGNLTIAEADTELPDMRNFTIDRPVFSPNRDGIDDRALIQFFLTKDVAELRVFLLTPEGEEVPIRELEREVPANTVGRHYYDYEGGVDNGETPPPDGTYPIVAIAQDLEGQRLRAETELTIEFGGVPRGYIFSPPSGDTLEFSATAVPLCHTLTFTVTLQNDGNTPLRTTGPEPGTVYDSDWNYNTLGWHTESGAWRVAIGYENELTNYPYRWALGDTADLEKIGDYYYLMPGERTVVTGGIRITGPLGVRNPQPMWAGLIHEDVEISADNNRVDTQAITIDLPDEGNLSPCDPREIPIREPS
jgi:hypothetical protein